MLQATTWKLWKTLGSIKNQIGKFLCGMCSHISNSVQEFKQHVQCSNNENQRGHREGVQQKRKNIPVTGVCHVDFG